VDRVQNQRVNHQIRITPIRLIDENGAQLGVLPTVQAMNLARERGLDLVEISPNVRPPVCKLMDYSKYKYQQQKAAKEAKKKQNNVELKEIQLRPNIGDHDLDVKVNKIKEFLGDGNKVKVVIRFAGREMAHTDLGFKLMSDVFDRVSSIAKFENKPVLEGKFLRAILTSI
jgi:translation initiation factor IF-3